MLTDTPRQVLLALDTSTDRAAIGLKNGASFTELAWPAGRSQTTSLLMAIDWLLDMSGLSTDDLEAIAVASGPGTFTGLRVGLSLAKGLVLARDLPLIGIPTLEVTAFPYQAINVSVCAMLPAGRGRIVWAISEEGSALSAPTNSTVPEVIAMLTEHPHLLAVGEILEEHRQQLEAANVRTEPAALGGRRPAVLAQLAWDRWQSGDVDDATLLEPIYIHGQRATGDGGAHYRSSVADLAASQPVACSCCNPGHKDRGCRLPVSRNLNGRVLKRLTARSVAGILFVFGSLVE